MLEKDIEAYLKREVERRGGICEKHSSPGKRGVPDRLVTWPSFARIPATMDLVELKLDDGPLQPWQVRDHARRAEAGIFVWVLRSKAEVDAYVAARVRRTA